MKDNVKKIGRGSIASKKEEIKRKEGKKGKKTLLDIHGKSNISRRMMANKDMAKR